MTLINLKSFHYCLIKGIINEREENIFSGTVHKQIKYISRSLTFAKQSIFSPKVHSETLEKLLSSRIIFL